MTAAAINTVKKRKTIRVKSKFRFILFVVMVLFAMTFAVNAMLSSRTATAQAKPITKTVTVSYGDTLWDIAESYQNKIGDIREAVFLIKEANGLTESDIKAGTKLIIPVSEL